MTWRAWHVFIADHVKADRYLLEVIAPEAAALYKSGAISNWFFIRYWENGPHIRFRLKDITDESFSDLGGRLRDAAHAAVAGTSDAAGHYLQSMRFDGWHADPSGLPWFEQGAVHEIMYEPEYRRYGGIQGLAVGEALFNLSSKVALKVISATSDSWAKRESVALRLTAATIMTLAHDGADALEFLKKMASAWLSFAPDPVAAEATARADYDNSAEGLKRLYALMSRLRFEPDDWPPLVHAYARGVAEGQQQLLDLAAAAKLISPLTGIPTRDDGDLRAALKSIVLSYIHMSNNRLGMSPLHEYRFAQMLLWASQDAVAEEGKVAVAAAVEAR